MMVLLFPLAIIIYLLPSFIASHRKCRSGVAIWFVNFFAGWTFIGWIVAGAWALAGEVRDELG